MRTKKLWIAVAICSMLFGVQNISAQQKVKSTTEPVKQEGTIEGIVRFKFNDYQGYKIDIGSTVMIVNTAAIDSIMSYEDIKLYEDLAGRQTNFYISCKDIDGGYMETMARNLYQFDKSDEDYLQILDRKVIEAKLMAISNKQSVALVGGDGLYSLKAPYGEYYLVFQSKNRERNTVTELTGRIHFERVNISVPNSIISFDFDY